MRLACAASKPLPLHRAHARSGASFTHRLVVAATAGHARHDDVRTTVVPTIIHVD